MAKTETLILGSIKFIDDGLEEKAIIRSIMGIIHCEKGMGWIIGDSLSEYFPTYLVLPVYKGEVIFECGVPNYINSGQP